MHSQRNRYYFARKNSFMIFLILIEWAMILKNQNQKKMSQCIKAYNHTKHTKRLFGIVMLNLTNCKRGIKLPEYLTIGRIW